MTDRNRQDHEERLQQLADRSPGDANDTAANAYRFVRRAVRVAPIPSVPADFAAQMEKLTHDFEEQAQLETWLLRVLLFVAGAGALAVAWPAATAASGSVAKQLAGAPWPLLLAAGVGAALAWVMDRYAGKHAASS